MLPTLIELRGPYHWFGQYDNVLFSAPEMMQAGVYLWTVPRGNQYLTYYVGETGRSFFARFTEHSRNYLSGLYRVYDPDCFAVGDKVLVWEGMWKSGTQNQMGVFLNRFADLAPVILRFLRLFRLFLIPLDTDIRGRQRLEAAIANYLYRQDGLIGVFQDPDIQYRPRRKDEMPIQCRLQGSSLVCGLSDELAI